MPSLKTQVELLFGGRCKRPPQGVHFAPGRAVLLGSHLESQGGAVLAAPLAQGVACAWGIRPDSRVVVWSMNARQKDSFHHDRIFKCGRGWSDLARGACAHVAQGGRRMPGIDLMVLGDLPIGEGLASSAAYLTVLLRSLYDAVDGYRSRWELAEDIPQIEREWLGRASGRVDPYTVAAAKPDDALLHVDARELDHERLPLAPGFHVDAEESGVTRPPDATGATQRLHELAMALEEARSARPSLASLCDLDAAGLAEIEESLGATSRLRARYLVGESERVRRATAELAAQAPDAATMATLGRLMLASHRSLATELDVSTPEIDSLIDLALTKPSILGARLQGDGWGGRVAVLQKDAGSVA